MSALRQLLQYIRHYARYAWLNVVCNILMVFFSLISIPMLVPFLDVLLKQTATTVPALPTFTLSIGYFKDYFYYQLYQLKIHFGDERALIYVCLAMALSFFFKNFFRYFAVYFITPLRTGVVRDLRQKLFEKSVRLPLSYFSEERKGDLMSRVMNDVGEVEWSILNVLETVVREPLSLIGALIIMIALSPHLTLFVLVLMFVTGVIIGGIGRALKRESRISQEKLGNIVSVLEEGLSGMRVIKGFNAEKYQINKFSTENNAYRRVMNSAIRRRDLSSPLTEFLGISIVCVLVWYGFKQVETGELTPSKFIAFLYAFFTVIDPAKSLSQAYYNIQKGTAALERINYMLDADETITDAGDAVEKKSFDKMIEFRNVSFNYVNETDKKVLKNINLEIPKGKIVALVGASGSGKSTLADLLPRFYDVSAGEILIDGINIKNIKLHDLRALLGIVTQEALLFNDTVANNIIFGMSNEVSAISYQASGKNNESHIPDTSYLTPDTSQVLAAAVAAQAADFIDAMPEKFSTNIGDRGTKLSGGQRQRLTIARALLRNPEILILDEATSALDSESEQLVQTALNTLMRGRTALVIAHRLATIKEADLIIVLKDGEIIERGTHDALVQIGGEYSKLVLMQGIN